MNLIPTPPNPLVIPEEDLTRLEKWMAFFRGLSSRVFVMQPRDDDFGDFLERAQVVLREQKSINPEDIVVDWPTEAQIAFVVSVNTASPGAIVLEHTLYDAVVFCFGNVAFRIRYFERDSDPNAGDWTNTWSLASYEQTALSWSYLAERIVNQIKELENQVPEPPTEAPSTT